MPRKSSTPSIRKSRQAALHSVARRIEQKITDGQLEITPDNFKESIEATTSEALNFMEGSPSPEAFYKPSGPQIYSDFVSFLGNLNNRHYPRTQDFYNNTIKMHNHQKRAQRQVLVSRAHLNARNPRTIDIRDANLASLPRIPLLKLAKDECYPPINQHIAETVQIYHLWKAHFENAHLHDSRDYIRNIHLLDPGQLQYTVEQDQSVVITDKSDDSPVLVVFRNFCGHPGGLKECDDIISEDIKRMRSVRKGDSGKLSLTGFSAGSRSAIHFDWARNFEKLNGTTPIELKSRQATIFAFFWNICQGRLPSNIIATFTEFLNNTGMPRMDPQSLQSYTINIANTSFVFKDVEMAPPSGVLGENYTRFIHKENQPHPWAVSWTTSRSASPDAQAGSNFYVAQYGVCVKAATNTAILWRPADYHGTSLFYHDGDGFTPICKSFQQRGMACITSNQLPSAWEAYKKASMPYDRLVMEMNASIDSHN